MTLLIRPAALFCLVLLFGLHSFAHNGKIGRAYPLANITVDGDLKDWPKNAIKYPINTTTSDMKPAGQNDFSGFFQVGYSLNNRSLYLAIVITDDSFIEDTSANVAWNTQDGLELNIDARHLPFASGVASFMYTKKLRNVNKAAFDAFAKNISWDNMEVALVHRGNTRFYEWRIKMNDELQVGKSIGIDFQCFDKDADGSFSFTSWGPGASKYRDPNSLADILILPATEKIATIAGKMTWKSDVKIDELKVIHITSVKSPSFWVAAVPDSNGDFSAEVPAGQYKLVFAGDYYYANNKLYGAHQDKPVTITAKPAQTIHAATINVVVEPVPDLIPEKGVLHSFSNSTPEKIDSFIETYRRYCDIPGVSLAIVKEGKLIYYNTYGVRNTFTGEKVDENTLFEAASITKPVFAFAVQRLAERGIIDLDKPLYQYLPYKDIEYDDRYKLITAKHVLTHRTGFPNWRSMNPDNKLDLKFTPGTKYNYSGEGFEYLKIVVEKITGKKVAQVLQEEVIQPMGLYHTFFSANDSLKQMKAEGHFNMFPSSKGMPDQPGMAYSMHTEAKIFTNFMLYLLKQKGLSESTYKTMLSKQSEYPVDSTEEKPSSPAYMGMSLEVRETPFGISFGHGGNNGDFKCRFEMFKDLKMGYVVFTNSNTADLLLYDALGRFLIEGKK